MAVLHGYHSSPGGHDLYVTSSWLDFVALQPGHGNSEDASNNAQKASYWTGVYSTTNNKPILVTEAHYAHLNENSQVGYFGPAPSAAGMRADVDGMVANDPGDGRLIGITYGDWYRVVFCDPADTLKFDNALADGFYNGVKTTRFPSGSAGASFAGVANAIGNDGETEYLEALGIISDPGGVTVAPGSDIQDAIDAAPNFGIVNLTADTIYENAQLNVPLGKTVTLQGTGQWNSGAATGSLIMGGELVTGWVADGGKWRASWTGTPISRLVSTKDNQKFWARAADRLTCTLDEGWLHHASSLAEMDAGVPTNMTGHAGQYWFDYGSQTLWVDTDPTSSRVALSTVNQVITGGGTLLIKDLSVGLSRSDAQDGMIRPAGPDWVLENVEVFGSHGVGIQGKSDRTHVNGCHIHHNGQLGLGDSSSVNNKTGNDNTSGGICEETLIEYNNMSWYTPGWEAGATKVAWHDDYIFRHNEVRYNFGMGLWDDLNCVNTQYLFNYVHDNWYAGIHHEIGMSAIIEYNRVENNGTWPTRNVGAYTTFPNQSNDANWNIGWSSVPGIVISESNGLEDRPGGPGYGIIVRNNLVYDNRGGIFLRQIDRDDDTSAPGGDAYWNKGISVLDNDVWWDDTTGGWPGASEGPKHGSGDSHGSHDPFAAASLNDFDGNDYSINSTETIPTNNRFEWSGAKTYAQWLAVPLDATTGGRAAEPEDFGLTGSTIPPTQGTDGHFVFTGNTSAYLSTPDSPQLSVTGKLRIDVLAEAADWTSPSPAEALVGKYSYAANDAAWRLFLRDADDELRIQTTTTGNPSSAVNGSYVNSWSDDTKRWVSAEMNATGGSYLIRESTDETTWTTLASGSVAPHTIWDGTGPVEIGRVGGVADNAFTGKIFAVRIYNNDVLIADPDFRNTTQATGGNWSNGGVDSFGNVWTVNGALQYVVATTDDQVVNMVSYGFPAGFTLESDFVGTVNQELTVATTGAFTLAGSNPTVILDQPAGGSQTVSFTDPFAFSLSGSTPTHLGLAQTVTFTEPFAFSLGGGVPLVDPITGPDPTNRALGLTYGYFARYVADGNSESYLNFRGPRGFSQHWAEVQSSAALETTGDIAVEFWGRGNWPQMNSAVTFAAKNDPTASVEGPFQFGTLVHASGYFDGLFFKWGEEPGNVLRYTSTRPTPAPLYNPSELRGFRAVLDVDNGVGQYEVRFYSSSDPNDPWVPFGDTVVGTTGPTERVAEPTFNMTIGNAWSGLQFVGDILTVIVRASTAEDAAPVFKADFSAMTPGAVAPALNPVGDPFAEYSTVTSDTDDEIRLYWIDTSSFNKGETTQISAYPDDDRLVLVPIGRSQQIGFKVAEGFEQVSDVITWITGQEDELMVAMSDAWTAALGDTQIALTVAMNDALQELDFRRPDGSDVS